MTRFTYRSDSMSIQALKRVASAPYRLSSALLGRGTTRTDTRIFKLDTAGQGPPPQYALNLLTGGRWLVHADRGTDPSGSAPARICLSDMLEINDGALQASVSFPLLSPVDSWPTINSAQSDPKNSRFIIVVSYLSGFPLCVYHFAVSERY